VEGTGPPPVPAAVTDAPAVLEPSDSEVAEWAERERQRREAWLSGPTAAERAAWAQRERERRLAGLRAEQDHARSERGGFGMYFGMYALREAQLAAEGAVSLVWKEVTTEGPLGAFRKWSRRGLDVLVSAGREWEEEAAQAGRRRPVPSDEQAP
jgi:hypothetical protein